VGGLADVIGSLPKYIASGKDKCIIILPKYKCIDDKQFKLTSLPFKLSIPLGKNEEKASVKRGNLSKNIPVYFITNNKYFGRDEVYGTKNGDYEDNNERFTFFQRAVLETAKALNFRPDVIHCHDWQTGLIPAYLKKVYDIDPFFSKTASVYTIHNIAYQGFFTRKTVDLAGLPWSEFSIDKLEYYGGINFLKAGIVYADAVSTVSPAYSNEIQTQKFGAGMEGILEKRKDDLYGILNGIDYSYWNPGKDRFIKNKFNKTSLNAKKLCKNELLKECGLKADADALVAGCVSRLDPQKGFDLITDAIPELVEKNVKFVILGKGDTVIENEIRSLDSKYKDSVKADFTFNEPLAHKIYAGSDVFLMPSRFEPCGLSQMISLAYATVPIVSKTGGLADTITEYIKSANKGNGFVLDAHTREDLISAFTRAIKLYNQKNTWEKLMKNAINCEFSWVKSKDKYLKAYKRAADARNKVKL
jgi:starch synthase